MIRFGAALLNSGLSTQNGNAVSVDSLTKKLEVLYGLAFANKQTGAAVAAVGLMAKIHGFITDRAQVEQTVTRKPSRDPGAPARMTPEEWEAKYAPSRSMRRPVH